MDFAKLLNIVYDNAGHLSIICLSINVLICAWNFRKLSIPHQRICYFLMLGLATEILVRVFIIARINNLPLLHIYTLGEFITLSFFYKSLIQKPPFFQNKFWHLVIGGSVLIILNSLFLQNIYEFNPLAKTAVQLVVIGLAVLYFYNLTENQSLAPAVEKSLRLINSALLIYYSGSLFVFMCSQIFMDNAGLYRMFWVFNAVLNFICQLLILWALWKMVFKKTLSSS